MGDVRRTHGNGLDLDAVVRESVQKWRDSLINLTRRNRLLNFKPSETSSIRLRSPAPAVILNRLANGRTCEVMPGQEDDDAFLLRPEPKHLTVTSDGNQANLRKAVKNLRTRANAQYLDTGLHVLYMGFGMLTWSDVDDEVHRSPVLLLPVLFQKDAGVDQVVLRMANEEVAVNPALVMKMKDLGVEIPGIGDNAIDADAYEGLLGHVREAIRSHPNWSVTEEVWLTYFAFTKESMYRDLLEHADMIASHPQVAALAASGTGLGPAFHLDVGVREDLQPDRIDESRPPERYPTVLDADASQRRVIAAVVSGNSVVVSGPPGTGKSQTIANLIASLMHAGKSVLFVSEKAAALEVVYNRLDHVGLAGYVLELHSHKSTRAQVSAALSEALHRLPVPPKGLPENDRDQVQRRRMQLNEYAHAINEVRQPLGLSLINVMGQVALLNDAPTPDPARHLAAGLTNQQLGAINDAARSLTRAWRPAIQGQEYLWRDVTDAGTLRPRLEAAQSAFRDLQEAIDGNREVAEAFDLSDPESAPRLSEILMAANTAPGVPVPDSWWTMADLREVGHALDQLAGDIAATAKAQHAFQSRVGVPWTATADVPAIDEGAVRGLQASVFTVPNLATVKVQDLVSAARTAQILDQQLANLSSEVRQVSRELNLPPAGDVNTVGLLLRIFRYAESPLNLEPAWMTPSALEAAKQAVAALAAAHQTCVKTEAAAKQLFTERILDLDVSGLQSRFANVHTGLRRLGGDYRTDKHLVAEATKPGVKVNDSIAELDLAAQWQQALEDLHRVELHHAPILGAHYQGGDTNWTALQSALEQSRDIVDTLGRYASDLTALVRSLNGQSPHKSTARNAAATLTRSLENLGKTIEDSAWPIKPGWATTPFPNLHESCSVLQRDIEAIGQSLVAIDTMTQMSWTIGEAIQVLQSRQQLQRRFRDFDVAEGKRLELLESHYQAFETDIPSARKALRWITDLRTLATGTGTPAPFTPAQARALRESVAIDLSIPYERWRSAISMVVAAFETHRHDALREDLSDFREGQALLEALLADMEGQSEWFVYKNAKSTLHEYQLDSVVDFCVENRVPKQQLPDVIRKSVLTGWIDSVLAEDQRLEPFRLQDRDALVAEYRDLDQRLIDTAISEILARCNDHRPQAHGNQVALIDSEGQRRRKHMPVRELIRQSRNVTLRIKPCFMMSPQSVSQYLPPDIQFDVVIFDEASQVKPEDAINSIYRGKDLVIVGDKNQMPPTSFWNANLTSDDDEVWSEGNSTAADYESILDLARGSSSFDTLMLQTHYRSRHEDLIAFSNHSFYGGQLHTFPSAAITTDDLGVELIFVPDGEYQRGGTHDNPREAQVVVDRVFHHYDNRPQLTIGVVAFSQAQAVAIELALDERLKERPDLRERIESADRLDGFFVKNLETVQGDERDVIVFSVGYGPDATGKITNEFGPLNRPKGWRRLNVAITRARNRVELVSSIRADDVKASDNESVRHLKAYLAYAEQGPKALALDDGQIYGDPESPFEESVVAVLREWGYQVESQVGTAGYRIDIGVRHPEHPGRFMLGIECDGYAYHSSKTARDRDRIRHDILVGLGWNLHHIWGTSWYRHRENAEMALREALKQAEQAAPHQPPPDSLSAAGPATEPEYEEIDLDATPGWAQPYTRTVLDWPPRYIDGPSSPAALPHLINQIEQIAQDEGPIHIDLIDEHIREAWSVGRIGSRIRDNIDAAIKAARVRRKGDFIADETTATNVRYPADGVTRTIQQVSNEELRTAIALYVRDSRGISQDSLIERVARLYGWTRTGSLISGQIERHVLYLRRSGQLTGDKTCLRTMDAAEPAVDNVIE